LAARYSATGVHVGAVMQGANGGDSVGNSNSDGTIAPPAN